MKKSPLQLDWVTYPTASYEYLEDADGDAAIPVDVTAEVTWDLDGGHMVSVSLKNRDDSGAPYRFNVLAAAVFRFDLEEANQHYKPDSPLSLPAVIAVNVCRIVFSGAREQIAMMTARGPVGPALIESVIIEPSDLKIGSTAEPRKILLDVFKVPEELVRKIEKRAEDPSAKRAKTTKSK